MAAGFLIGGAARGSAKGGSAAFIGGRGPPAGGIVRGPGGADADGGRTGGAVPLPGGIEGSWTEEGGGVEVEAIGLGVDAGLALTGVLRAAGGGGGAALGVSEAPAVLLTQRLSSLS